MPWSTPQAALQPPAPARRDAKLVAQRLKEVVLISDSLHIQFDEGLGGQAEALRPWCVTCHSSDDLPISRSPISERLLPLAKLLEDAVQQQV
ncbi:MAG: hypothetical protein HC876_21290, partial [Chloroflexaceae bacterium]|nr:hypothetical protein [Chloroflexaceae bacterium]